MRYYQIAYPDEHGNDIVEVLSEDDVRKQYWPHWYQRMCDKYGQKEVDKNWSFEDCLSDWVCVHWAMEIENDV